MLARGGPVFCPIVKGGTSIFSRMQGGGPEKIDDRPSQIDGPPLPLKNDSSLEENSYHFSQYFPHVTIPFARGRMVLMFCG